MVGVPDLTLVVLSGGVELGSGAAVRRWSVGSGCVVALRLNIIIWIGLSGGVALLGIRQEVRCADLPKGDQYCSKFL